MLKRFSTFLTIILLAIGLAGVNPQTSTWAADISVVHAVLFYSPSCGHCQKVINQDIPPLIEKYQDQLQIIGVDVTLENGQILYQSAIQAFKIGKDRLGVPALIVGDTIMVGADEIPSQFPVLIEQGLASGGIPWPDIPGLAEALTAEPGPSDQQVEQAAQGGILTVSERFALDPIANTMAVVVLIGMVLSVILIAINFKKVSLSGPRLWPAWVVVGLIVIGLFAAGYLSYVEVSNTEAVCGPVGNCNVVQQSPYARLFGILPVGLLGLTGYLSILAAWLLVQFGKPDLQRTAGLVLWGFAWIGTLFSIYLTFLEPFVIGASCAWCLTSAIVMTLLLWAATPIAQKQFQNTPKPIHRSRQPGMPIEG